MKNTPGPWKFQHYTRDHKSGDETRYSGFVASDDNASNVVAEVIDWSNNDYGGPWYNGTIIAAAPQMLDALMIVKQDSHSQLSGVAKRMVEAAINKAQGS